MTASDTPQPPATDGEDDLERFFQDRPRGRVLFDAVRAAIAATGATRSVTKSQIAFWRRRPFAWAWTPDRWLRGEHVAPLVLSVALARRDASPRWKQVGPSRAGRRMHHLELWSLADVDDDVRARLRRAADAADRLPEVNGESSGPPRRRTGRAVGRRAPGSRRLARTRSHRS